MGQHGFVEDGRSLRQGHGRVRHQRAQPRHAAVVPRVTQLVGEGGYVREAALEVGHHKAAVIGMGTGTERAAGLAFAGIHIDPVMIEGVLHKFAHGRGELAQLQHQLFAGLLRSVGAPALAHRCEQIIEGQTVLMAQIRRLGAHIAAEVRQVFLNGGEHGVQRRAVHAAACQRPVQHGVVAVRLGQGAGLHLDAVQAVGHGQFDLLIGSNLRLVGVLAHGCIGIVRHAAHCRQRQRLSAVFHRVGGVQLVPQLGERAGAGQLHLQHPGLNFRRNQVVEFLLHLPQGKGDALQLVGGGDDLLQIIQTAHKAGQSGGEQAQVVEHDLNPAHVHGGVSVGRIHRQGQHTVAHQVLRLGVHRLQIADHVLQMLAGFALAVQQISQRGDVLRQRLQVLGKARIVKALIKEGQIPCSLCVHSRYLLWFDMIGLYPSRAVLSRDRHGYAKKTVSHARRGLFCRTRAS